MDYKEVKMRYDQMGIGEFGINGMNHASTELDILRDIPNVAPIVTEAGVVLLVMHYNAMQLYARNMNFLMRAYITAVNHGVTPTWHDKTYINHLEKRNASGIRYRSLEHGLGKLVEHYEREYRDSIFITVRGDRNWSDEEVRKGHDNFANYGSDEKPLFYESSSLIGFSSGLVGTDKKIYFSYEHTFSVKYEHIIDLYFEYYEYDTHYSIPLFRIEDMNVALNQLEYPFSTDNIYWYIKILYYDEATGEVRSDKFSAKVVWDNVQHVNFAWEFIRLLKDTIFLKNYDRYIEARRKIDPEFAAAYEAEAAKPKKPDYATIFGEMSTQARGAKCKELLDVQYRIIKSAGTAPSEEIDRESMDLIVQYSALGLKNRINSFIADMRNASAAKNIELAFLEDKTVKMFDMFVSRYTINEAISKFFEENRARDSFEKFDNSRNAVKKLEKAKKAFANLSADEVPLAYLSDSLLGFSKGFVFTNKRMHFNTDKCFTVPYENVAEIYIQSSKEDYISIHSAEELKHYCKVNPYGWEHELWYYMIAYYDPRTGQLQKGRFRQSPTISLDYAEYMFRLADVIMNYAYTIKAK